MLSRLKILQLVSNRQQRKPMGYRGEGWFLQALPLVQSQGVPKPPWAQRCGSSHLPQRRKPHGVHGPAWNLTTPRASPGRCGENVQVGQGTGWEPTASLTPRKQVPPAEAWQPLGGSHKENRYQGY